MNTIDLAVIDQPVSAYHLGEHPFKRKGEGGRKPVNWLIRIARKIFQRLLMVQRPMWCQEVIIKDIDYNRRIMAIDRSQPVFAFVNNGMIIGVIIDGPMEFYSP